MVFRQILLTVFYVVFFSFFMGGQPAMAAGTISWVNPSVTSPSGSTDTMVLAFENPIEREYTHPRMALAQTPIPASFQGLPIGNGVMGSMVWTLEDKVCLQINRVDIFPMNSYSTSFFKRNEDYCGAAGLVDLSFPGTTFFSDGDFKRKLDMRTGLVTLDVPEMTVEAFAAANHDVIVLRIHDKRRGNHEPVRLRLRMLRPPRVKTYEHLAESFLSWEKDLLQLRQRFTEGDFYCGSAVAVSANPAGQSVTIEDDRAYISIPAGADFTVYIASSAAFDPARDLKAVNVSIMEDIKAKGFEQLFKENIVWWNNFWDKSHVSISSQDGRGEWIEKNYNFYRYIMGSTSRGALPPKFNGMLFISHGDVRPWGAQYWWHNTACLYRGLPGANHIELTNPMTDLYLNMLESCRLAARQQWDSEGVFLGETMYFDGFAPLPGNLVQEMQDLYLCRREFKPSREFLDYALYRNPRNSRWNWKSSGNWVDGKWTYRYKEKPPFGHVTHLFSSSSRMAWNYWVIYQTSQDKSFLRKAYPLIKGIADFHTTFPNIKKGADGLYHSHHTNMWEYQVDETDTQDTIAGMETVLGIALRAVDILGIDEPSRARWREYAAHLPPLATSRDESGKLRFALYPGCEESSHNDLFAVSYFPDVCNPEIPDQKRIEIAHHTLDLYWRDRKASGNRQTGQPIDALDGSATATAVMGRREFTKDLLHGLVHEDHLHCNLFSPRESNSVIHGTTVQSHGVMAKCLHIALAASFAPEPGGEPIIRPFHAWPVDWDVEAKIVLRGGYLFTGKWEKQNPVYYQLRANKKGHLRVRNLFPDIDWIVTRNGTPVKLKTESEGLWKLDVKAGDVVRWDN